MQVVTIGTITVAGTDIPTSAPTASTNPAAANVLSAGATEVQTIWAKLTTKSASAISSYDIYFVDSYDGSSGSWRANVITESAGGTDSDSTGKFNVTVSAAQTIWRKFQTNTVRTSGACSVFVVANGGSPATGDTVTFYLVGGV
jgi:hypothetical protein